MKAKLVYENIDFERGVDPLKAMGIGGYSFDTLKKGAILEVIDGFCTTNGGNLRGYSSGGAVTVRKGSYILIKNIWDNLDGTKSFYYRPYYNTRVDWAEEDQIELRKTGNISRRWGDQGFITNITKRKFDYRLKVFKP